jgi:23S rRNA (guanosine2251-2'-O)-methyltransferase
MRGADNFLEITSLSAIAHMIAHRPERVQRLIIRSAPEALKRRVAELQDEAKRAGIAVVNAPQKGKSSESPVAALVAPFPYTDLKEFIETLADRPRAMVLALDHLQDSQNFGALCRSAEAFGFAGVLLPKDRGVTVNAGVYAASVGAIETLPVVLVGNLGDALRKLKDAGFWILGSSLGEGAKAPWETPDFEKTVLVLGAELEGMSQLVEKTCDWKIQIPIHGHIQSLNVSAAGAVLMYELTRPRTK